LSGHAPDGLCAACLLESAFGEGGDRPDKRSTPAPLLVFKDYELLEEIARGGMGVVYRARQISLNRTVAIKMILGGHLANTAEKQRFRAEAETAAQLQHPGIVAIHEVGEHAGQPFFSMDLVEGRNLAQLVRDGPLPSCQAAGYLKAIAEAVQYAHSRGVLHRDLKPSNVLIDDNDRPRVTDFGLAKKFGVPPSGGLSGEQSGTATKPAPAEAGTPNDLTQTGQVLGSPSFIPPEQAAGNKDAIGPASDVYSLGAILYHLLTGRPPFMADTMPATLRMVAETEAVSPRLLNPDLPRDLETICLKCLEKEAGRRYLTAHDLSDDLGRFLRDEPILARPVSRAEKLWRACRRMPALASAVLLLAVIVVGSPFAAFRISQARSKAAGNARTADAMVRFAAEMLEGAGASVAQGRDTTVLREILDRTAGKVASDLKDQPQAEASLRLVLGKTYHEIGLTTNALAMTREAIRLRQECFGSDSLPVADAYHNLGAFLCDMGNPVEAEGVERQALAMRIRFLGENHTNVAMTLNNLGVALWSQGRSEEAERLHLKSLDIRRRLLPPDHPDLGMSLANLGNLYATRGDLAAGDSNYVLATEIFSKHYGRTNPLVALLQHNRAIALYHMWDLDASEKLLRETVDLRRQLYQSDHFHVASSIAQLGIVRAAQGDLDGADDALKEALAMQDRLKLGRVTDVANTLAGLGTVLTKRGKWAEAEAPNQQACEIRLAVLGEANAEVIDSLDALALLAALRGDLVEAERKLLAAIDCDRKAQSRGHTAIAAVLFHLSWVHHRRGELEEAAARRQEALEFSARQGLASEVQFLRGIYDLADGLMAGRDFPETERLLLEASDFVQTRMDGSHALQQDSFQRLVRFYEAWNHAVPDSARSRQANDWKGKLQSLNQESVPPPPDKL